MENETEREIVRQTAELAASTAVVVARTLRGVNTIRLALQDVLPAFEKAYRSRFAEADQGIVILGADLIEAAQKLGLLLHPQQTANTETTL